MDSVSAPFPHCFQPAVMSDISFSSQNGNLQNKGNNTFKIKEKSKTLYKENIY